MGTGLLIAAAVSLVRAGDAPQIDSQLPLSRASSIDQAGWAVTSCRARYTVTSQAAGRFTAIVTVTNTGPAAVNGWTLQWQYPSTDDTATPRIGDGWNATVSSDASGTATATSSQSSGVIPAGASTTIGLVGTSSGSTTPRPARFTLNGKACQ